MAAVPKARLTINELVYHQLLSESAQVVGENRTGRFLHNEEVPYNRPTTVGTEWTDLDLKWVDRPTQIYLENITGYDRQVIPTPEELADDDARVVEVANGTVPFARVRPGESCRFEPVPGVKYLIRSRHATARLKVVAIQGDD